MTRIPTLIAVLLALGACSESSPPVPIPAAAGTYRLVSVAGRTLPTAAPCGVFRVVEGSLSLHAGGTAEHHLRYSELGSGREVTYAAAGRYRIEGDEVVLDVVGRWSNSPGADSLVQRLQGVPGGLTRVAGMECDAADAELYRSP